MKPSRSRSGGQRRHDELMQRFRLQLAEALRTAHLLADHAYREDERYLPILVRRVIDATDPSL